MQLVIVFSFFFVTSLISYILLFDLKYANYTPTLSPSCKTFVDHVYEDLLKLHHITIGRNEATTPTNQIEAMEIDGKTVVDNTPNGGKTDETKRLERLAKTGNKA